jgi:hypothetical protein
MTFFQCLLLDFRQITTTTHFCRSEGLRIMNTLYNFLTIAFLASSLFISGLTVDLVSAQNTAVDSSASQRPADQLLSRYLRFNRLTTADGLSNLQVRGVTQDNYGFMWFTTFDGLNRYDGASVKVYTDR